MMTINADSLAALQPELTSGERVLWTGQPRTSIVFHKEDVYLIPFSLLGGGFAIFWEYMAAGGFNASHPAPFFFLIWGVPFIVVGQYMIWGRFLYSAWKKKRTHYGVTDRRVIATQIGSGRKTASAFLDNLPALIKENSANGIGTLRFAAAAPVSRRRDWGVWDSMAMGENPTFVDIEDVDSVYRLISEQREKLTTTKATW